MTKTQSSARASYLAPLAAVVLVVGILYLAKPVIVPLALAVLLTFVLTPIVLAIQRLGAPRVVAAFLTVILALVLVGMVSWVVGAQVKNLATELPNHRKEIDAKIIVLRGSGEGAFAELIQMIREIGRGETRADAAAEAADKAEKVIASAEPPSSLEQAASAAGPVLEPLAQAGLVIILVVFMLVKREDLRNRFIEGWGDGRLTGTTRLLVDAAQRLSSFLLSQLLINIGFGVLFAMGLFFLGVPYALLWGLLAMVLRFVPYIGSWVAVAFPLVLAFALASTWTQPILVLVWFAVLELITANAVEPLVFGHGTGVSPIALLIAAAFWTWLWGPIGLVLSTPLTVCLVALGQHVPRMRILAVLLSDQPALRPYVRYYQRLLARDQQEAEHVALEHAQSGGPERVYDDVLLPALELARRDRKDSEINGEDESYIIRSTQEILDRLTSEPEPTARPEPGPAVETGNDCGMRVQEEARANEDRPIAARPASVKVMGCPAHHEAEELSLAMLAQLLEGDGCRLEIVSTKALPAEVSARIEQAKPALAFIAVLPPGGFIQAQYLCRLLRKRFADLPIIVGYWGDERHFDHVLVRARLAGASYVTTSLLQSRSQIRALTNLVGDTSNGAICPKQPAPSNDRGPKDKQRPVARAAG